MFDQIRFRVSSLGGEFDKKRYELVRMFVTCEIELTD